ncbi:MAG: TonB-dependent receptor, partial [Bacteroidetes bacterium]
MRALFFLIGLIFSTVTLLAQTGTIRGTLLDGSLGETIIGGNVYIEGMETTGTVTDLDGNFSLQVAPGTYTLKCSYIGLQPLSIKGVVVRANEVTLLGEIVMSEDKVTLDEVVVKAEAIRKTEAALLMLKQKAPAMLDGISSSRMQLTGDATAVEAAKRVTGVSIEGGKYIYVRGLGDRYTKTTLNEVEIPGLDPDRNTLQMDIFPTALLQNIMVSKNFTAEMPADFTGGLLNVETKAFPEQKLLTVSVSTSINPEMHFNPNFLTYQGGETDWLGYDDGTRALPAAALGERIPSPVNASDDQEVNEFVRSFNPTLGTTRRRSLVDYSAGISLGNQVSVGKNDHKLGYTLSLSYRNSYRYYDEVTYGEYQRQIDPNVYEMRYATVQNGELGEQNVLIGALGGLAYKTKRSKIRLSVMHLQNGENRAGRFDIDDNGEAVGRSGYFAQSDNLEYNQRSLSNLLLNGTHRFDDSGWEIDWRLSPTLSKSEDPDIRKTAYTYTLVDTLFVAGAGGNPSRIWRYLDELNATAKVDIRKRYTIKGEDAKLSFGASQVYKERDYEILFFDMQFFGNQDWPNPNPATVLDPNNIYPNRPNSIYYASGNRNPNPNAYNSTVSNTAFYISNEINLSPALKTILGLRAENYVQRHTGRDQRFASGDVQGGRNLDNEVVLDNLDFFPSANLIYSLRKGQNVRLAYSRTIARPSFKELSFAQILDPITNRIFNGSLFTYSDWNGQLVETRINNLDLRWELFQEEGQLLSLSAFYKAFDQPIELVRIPEQQTSTEFQPRNVGDGQVYGIEAEVRKNLGFLSGSLSNLSLSSNVTLVKSLIDMSNAEFLARKGYEKTGQKIEDTRQMAGQAPYVINAGLIYNDAARDFEAGLFYNVKGRTLEIVGGGLFPDIYFQPFHSLNFSFSKKLGTDGRTNLTIQASNLL